MSNVNGQRKSKSPSTKERIRELEVANQNLQMAIQMSQMMVKHLTNQFQTFQNDLGSTMGMLNDFQYRTLAMLDLGNFKSDEIDAKAEELKLADFDKASDQEDALKSFTNDDGGVVGEDSVVILTSKTPDLAEDQGIFRSKFPMSECLTPELREDLLGLKVGDSIETEIYNTKHVITIVGLRKVPAPVEAEVEGGDAE